MATLGSPPAAPRRIDALTLAERRAILGSVALIATDVDGTLTQAGEIPAPIVAALADLSKAGIEVVPCWAGRAVRPAAGLRPARW